MHFIISAILLSSLFLPSIVAKPTVNEILVARGLGNQDDDDNYDEDKRQSKLGFQKVLEEDLQEVHLRVEGTHTTIFEGLIRSGGHSVNTTSSGGPHKCDGTNNHTYPKSGNTPTATLDTASKLHFPFDATFNCKFDDFFITSIGQEKNTPSYFWLIFVNYKFLQVGGCQLQTKTNDKVLFAFTDSSKVPLLKLDGPDTVIRNHAFDVTVTGAHGDKWLPVAGATVKGGSATATTDALGHATFTLGPGEYTFKAEKRGSIRSNAEKIKVI